MKRLSKVEVEERILAVGSWLTRVTLWVIGTYIFTCLVIACMVGDVQWHGAMGIPLYRAALVIALCMGMVFGTYDWADARRRRRVRERQAYRDPYVRLQPRGSVQNLDFADVETRVIADQIRREKR